MRVYVLHFENMGRLTRAFDRVLEDADVESSMIEPDGRRLRFVGPRLPADRLVEVIYQDGGLTWCSRHDLAEMRAAVGLPMAEAVAADLG